MMDLYIDETNLYNRMWLYTKQFDWEKMWAIADNVTDEEAIRAKHRIFWIPLILRAAARSKKVWDMARYVVAFEQWVKDEKIAFVASHYDGFAKVCRQTGLHADSCILDAHQAGHCLRG